MSSLSRGSKRRRSVRQRPQEMLAQLIVGGEQVVVITGAGLSVASGIPPFRGSAGIWSKTLYTQSTRAAFRRDPLQWWNAFWLRYCHFEPNNFHANPGHRAIAELAQMFTSNVRIVTQNVDTLHHSAGTSKNIIEAHGRIGLYKCCPPEDSDSDSDDDDDDDRPVHLGHRRKDNQRQSSCPYQWERALTVQQLEPIKVRGDLLGLASGQQDETHISQSPTEPTKSQCCESDQRKREEFNAMGQPLRQVTAPPLCPICRTPALPLALLFDEGYHSHSHYAFRDMEEWLSKADVVVFVGTSFAVWLTNVALEHCKAQNLRVYNFNTQDTLPPSPNLDVENVLGPAEETLPALVKEVKKLM